MADIKKKIYKLMASANIHPTNIHTLILSLLAISQLNLPYGLAT